MITFLRRRMMCGLGLVLIVLVARPASAQTGATTGAIIGTVTDNTKAVVPGVTVTASGPALMGARTDVSGAAGEYRIPALPPGEYTLVFDLPGFASVTRASIRISVGFTATINVEMNPAGVAESVTVSGASPVVDLASTKVTTDFGAEQLANLVGSRDYAAIMAQLPGVSMNRPSVGGSGAVTYQRSTKYGMQGHDRGEVEGIVSTQNMQGGTEAGYSDSDSFEDMAVNVLGNGAEMPNPGTFTKIVSKSGSNVYRGRVYADYQHEAFEAHNIDDAQIARGMTAPGSVGIRDLNRLKEFRDFSFDVGGYAIKDKLWWYGAYRKTYLAQNEVVLIDGTHVLQLPVVTGKVDFAPKQNHKLVGYWFHGIKQQNVNILGDLTDTALVTMDALSTQRWPNGVYKVEYDAVLGDAVMFEVRAGNYYTRSITDPRTDLLRYEDRGANRVYGATARGRGRNDRRQLNGSLTYFKDGWAGSHNFKFGGEFFQEFNRSTTTRVGNMLLLLNNGAPSQVRLYEPGVASSRGLWEWGAYVQDTWKLSERLTFNLGFRVDQLRSYVPAQTGAKGISFARVDAPVWTNPAPRIGVVYALTEDLKTLVKANYGQYWLFPLTNVSAQMNPNPSESYSLYTWTPSNPRYQNGFPVFEPGQEGRLVSVSGARPDGRSQTRIDPNLKNGFSRQALVYVEREVAPDFGVRTGFVWNGWRQIYGQVFANWPLNGFNVPVTLADPGRDGKLGTSDDGSAIQAFNLDPAYLSLAPDQVIQNYANQDSDYYTWEITTNKRQRGRWSLLASFSRTWSHQAVVPLQGAQFSDRGFQEYNRDTIAINTVDGRDVFSTWSAKASTTLDLGRGVRVTPMVQHQSGRPFARTFLAQLNFNSAVYVRAEPVGTERMPNLTLTNVRAEKAFKARKGTIGVFFDVYNIFNINTIQEATTSSGSGFLRPNVITVPRIARLGLKFNF